MRLHMPTAMILLLAMTLAYGTIEADVDGGMMAESVSPKIGLTNGMKDIMAFIQEDVEESKGSTCDCQPAVTKAYSKFRGDMKKIEELKEQSDARANKAETESQKQAGISRRCLAAESMLSADEKTKSKKMREAIAKETSVEAAQYQEKSQELAKQCTEKIALARKDEAAKAGSSVDAAVKKEQMRMKGEVEKFAAQKAEFKLKAKRMKMKLEGQAVLAKQKLEAIKAQLAAKSKECDSAK